MALIASKRSADERLRERQRRRLSTAVFVLFVLVHLLVRLDNRDDKGNDGHDDDNSPAKPPPSSSLISMGEQQQQQNQDPRRVTSDSSTIESSPLPSLNDEHDANVILAESASSVDYMACCGLGHRLSKLSEANYLAEQFRFGLRSFWGYCVRDQAADGDGGGSSSYQTEVFQYVCAFVVVLISMETVESWSCWKELAGQFTGTFNLA
jgi:hypothetical protein